MVLVFLSSRQQSVEDSSDDEDVPVARKRQPQPSEEDADSALTPAKSPIVIRQPTALEQKIMAAARERQRQGIVKKQVDTVALFVVQMPLCQATALPALGSARAWLLFDCTRKLERHGFHHSPAIVASR